MGTTTSNWGRWGPDDQVGTANLFTPEAIVRAATLVRSGRIYNLSVALGPDTPTHPIRPAPQHYVKFVPDAQGGVGYGEDTLVLSTHSGTHIDALSHFWVDGEMFNNQPADRVTAFGAGANSIDSVPPIWTRGVLLDVAAARGVERLQAGDVVTPDELKRCCERQGVSCEAGDAVLVRTGWYRTYAEDPARWASGKPGLGGAAIEWLIARDVAVLGIDTSAAEADPPDPADGPAGMAVAHLSFLHRHGGYLVETLDLEALGRDAVHEFLFVAAPLRISGGLGSPLTPLAVA
jgi:kynurenine formamidase